MGNICSSCCQANRSDSVKLRKPLDRQPQQLSSYHRGSGAQDEGTLHIAVSKRDSAGSSPFILIHQVTPGTRISGSHSLGSNQGTGNGSSGGNQTEMTSSLSPIGLVMKTENQVKNFVSRIPPLGRSGSSEFKGVSETKVLNLFAKYKDPSEDAILIEGVESFCLDLELKPDEFKVLILAWKCNLEQMCRFTRSEFITGCRSLKADSIKSIQNKLSEAYLDVWNSKAQFKDLYEFTFRFGLSPGQRVLPIDMAVSLWQLVFSINEPKLLQRWLRFLTDQVDVKGVTKDTWNMFLNLTEILGDDLSSYDDNEAWPTLFDDFVEYENDKANQNITKSDANSNKSQHP